MMEPATQCHYCLSLLLHLFLVVVKRLPVIISPRFLAIAITIVSVVIVVAAPVSLLLPLLSSPFPSFVYPLDGI